MKKIILLILPFLLVGCSVGQPTKESEMEKLETYFEDTGWTTDELGTVFVKELEGNYEDYPSFDKNYHFHEVSTGNLTYVEVYSNYSAESNTNIFYRVEYDYKQDVSNGTYRQTITTDNGLNFSNITTYMYDYKNGIKECTKKDSYGKTEECNISADVMGQSFLRTKEKFLDILENSEVDTSVLK